MVHSPAEAISAVLSSLRTLTGVTKSSAYLAEYRPAVVDLLARCFPTEDSIIANGGVPSRKGKERRASDTKECTRDHILVPWVMLACEVLDAPDAANLFEVQIVARLILAELHSRVIEPLADRTMDLDQESGMSAPTDVEVWLLTALAKIWSLALRRDSKGSGLQELLQYGLVVLAEAVTSLIELDGFSQVPQSAETLLVSFAMCLPAALGWHSPDAEALDPDDFTATFFASLRVVFARLAADRNVGAIAREAIASACGAARVAAVQVHTGEGTLRCSADAADAEDSPRKRRRVGDKEEGSTRRHAGDVIAPDSAEKLRQMRDEMRRVVGHTLAWARQEAEKDVSAAAASILAAAAEDSAEHTMLRYIAALPSASTELGAHLARTIGLLSCAKNHCVVFVAPDEFSAPTPTCAICDVDELVPNTEEHHDVTRTLTKEPLEALMRVFGPYLLSAKHEQSHLGALDLLRRLINHTAGNHPALQASDMPLVRLIAHELEHTRRSLRSAAG